VAAAAVCSKASSIDPAAIRARATTVTVLTVVAVQELGLLCGCLMVGS
jgi:hypothetical protein